MSDFTHALRNLDLVSRNLSIAIVASEFNADFVDEIVSKNRQLFEENGFSTVHDFGVPGALEIPSMVSRLVEAGSFDLILCIGVVIRGGTTHYDTVAQESARALMDITIETDTVIINGILTCENEDQVRARISHQHGVSGLNYVAELIEKGLIDSE